MKNVFLNQQFNLSASGDLPSLYSDYLHGKSPLRLEKYCLEMDPRWVGVAKHKSDFFQKNPWETGCFERFKRGLFVALEGIAQLSEEKCFDAILLGRGRIKGINPYCFEEDLEAFRRPEEMKNELLLEASKFGLELRDRDQFFLLETSCVTGISLVSIAHQMISSGEWKRVLLLSADPLSSSNLFLMEQLGVLSRNQLESPRVFHAKRDGFGRAEAFCAAILSDVPTGSQDLRVSGVALSSDSSSGLVEIEGGSEGLAKCIEQSMNQSRIHSEDLFFVKAHGTGTKMNDLAEYRALTKALGSSLKSTPVISFKSQFGHTTGSSGLFELSLSSHCLSTGRIMPVKNALPYDPEIGFLPLEVPFESSGKKACVNLALGFGGINGALVLEAI